MVTSADTNIESILTNTFVQGLQHGDIVLRIEDVWIYDEEIEAWLTALRTKNLGASLNNIFEDTQEDTY